MKAKLLIPLILNFLCSAVSSQAVTRSLAFPYLELNAYSSKPDAVSFQANQAALAATDHLSFGAFGERRFLLADAAYYYVAAVIPSRFGNFGISAKYGGSKNFNESMLGLAYARELGKKIKAGIQFNYYGYRVPGYKSASAITAEAAVLFRLLPQLQSGISIVNPVGGKMGEEKLPSVYKIALGYEPSDHFFVAISIIKEEERPVNCIAGLQYQFANKFLARIGMIGESSAIYGGAGLCWGKFRIDVCVSYHAQLGYSPGILVIVNGNEKK
jgi:hypothetical protein